MSKRRQLLIACAAVLAVPIGAVLGLLVHWIAGLVGAALAAVAVGVWLSRQPATALGTLATRSLPVAEAPRLHNVLEGVCASHGFAYPEVLLAEIPAINAALFGPASDDITLVVTRGLLDRSEVLGLEAAVANLLVRTRDSDIGVASLYPTVARLIPIDSVRRRVRRWAIGDRPRLRADLSSVRITRYPPGLVSLLETVSGSDTSMPGVAAAADHLWLLPAVHHGARGLGPDVGIDERIAILREL